MKSIKNYSLLLLFICLFSIQNIAAQDRIAVLQEPFVILLDPADGSILDADFIDLTSLNPGTPKAILQVNDEIWITDQLEDRIDIFDLDGSYLSTISGGMDNIKGLELVNNSEVWVTNAGSDNGAPGNAIVRFDLAGNNLGFFLTSGTQSTFDIIDVGGEVYISYIGSETKIERRDYNGNVLGNIVEEGVVQFIQQIELNETNNTVIAAVFSASGTNTNGFFEFSVADGSIVQSFDLGNLRGVSALENGNILISSSAGVEVLNPTDGSTISVTTNAAHFFGRLSLTPCTPPSAPTGDSTQTFTDGSTLEDIVVTPMDVTWYATEGDALTGTNPLPLNTVLENGESYYAVNFEGGCPSEPFEVTVIVTLGINNIDKLSVVMFPNPAKSFVRITHSEIIKRVSVINMLGQVVQENEYNKRDVTLNISSLPEALYILKIDFESYTQSIELIKSD